MLLKMVGEDLLEDEDSEHSDAEAGDVLMATTAPTKTSASRDQLGMATNVQTKTSSSSCLSASGENVMLDTPVSTRTPLCLSASADSVVLDKPLPAKTPLCLSASADSVVLDTPVPSKTSCFSASVNSAVLDTPVPAKISKGLSASADSVVLDPGVPTKTSWCLSASADSVMLDTPVPTKTSWCLSASADSVMLDTPVSTKTSWCLSASADSVMLDTLVPTKTSWCLSASADSVMLDTPVPTKTASWCFSASADSVVFHPAAPTKTSCSSLLASGDSVVLDTPFPTETSCVLAPGNTESVMLDTPVAMKISSCVSTSADSMVLETPVPTKTSSSYLLTSGDIVVLDTPVPAKTSSSPSADNVVLDTPVPVKTSSLLASGDNVATAATVPTKTSSSCLSTSTDSVVLDPAVPTETSSSCLSTSTDSVVLDPAVPTEASSSSLLASGDNVRMAAATVPTKTSSSCLSASADSVVIDPTAPTKTSSWSPLALGDDVMMAAATVLRNSMSSGLLASRGRDYSDRELYSSRGVSVGSMPTSVFVVAAPGTEEGSGEELTIDNVFDFEDKAENFVMAALFCASEEGNVDGLKELSEMANNIDLSTANKHGETAVHMAASGGHVDVLRFLQDKGVNINKKDKQGDTAIYWAARQGHLEVIKCLHEGGLSLDSQNKSEETALHVAARYGHAHVVEYLCGAEANINVVDSLGETPLHSAAWHGYVPIVRTLCAHEAVLDMQNKEGETVLHCAAVRGNMDCIRILLDHGAPLNHLDKRGSTALQLACQRHHSGIALLLLRAGCETDTMDKETGECALHVASREGLTEVVQSLCTMGCKVDSVSADGFTPLHQAIKAGHIEIARCLLMSGAQPDVPNKDGVTGEIIALAQGFMEIAELMSKVKGEKGQALIQQLSESPSGLSRIKLKVLGSTGVGKSLLIESLKCGFLGSFFRRRLPSSTSVTTVKAKEKLTRQFSLPTPLSYSVANPTYTKGVDIQQATITGAGDFSVWDFSGYEPYYMLYDHFLGDTNCLHLVTFSLQDAPDEQLAQIIFWLNFLKARVPPALPIGYCGQLPNTPRVLLVATHADKAGCSRNSRGEFVSVEASTLHLKMQQMFRHDINLADCVFVVDAQMATSADMKTLKQTLGAEKRDIVNMLPKSNGLLEATLTQLPTWRRENSLYPVVTWPDFTEAIRSKVNPLASNDHMKLLVEQLQLMGEVVYLESESGPDLIVLSPRWLCVDVIGSFMSHDKITQARITGCFSIHEFQLMYPETDAATMLQVFEALEVCTQCEVDGEVEYEFPCLNFTETLSGLWQKDDERYSDAVYGGVRLHTSFQSGAQLKYLFPRIQVFLRRNMLGESEDQEVDLYQWHHGSKYCWGQLEGLIDMDHNQQHLEIKVRGPPDSRYALFFFLEDFVNVVEQVVENVCPGLCTERYTLSPSQLQQHGKIVRSYSPTELLRMQLENRSSMVLSGTTTECFLDIACMGSEEVLHHLSLGMELDVSHLTIHTRRLLSLLLDPADPMGRDWCLLAVTLGLSDYLPSLDKDDTKRVSQTQRVLEEWARRCDSSVRDLVTHLKDFHRIDAVEAILRTTPPFRTLTYEDHSTDESAGAHGTDASTNTLSNLSR